MKILVLGASGMIGRSMFEALSKRSDWSVFGCARSKTFKGTASERILGGVDLTNEDQLNYVFSWALPEIVVNCAGVTKHVPQGSIPLSALSMNALLPHRLARLCRIASARLIHVSTDCVFSGNAGNYYEQDVADATDLYGRTKALGEVLSENSLTLRTSTIGHECGTRFGLVEWFLAQKHCRGYRHAIFSGLPTIEFARVVRDIVIPNKSLTGLYHVGAKPIDKFSLLQLVAGVYKRDIDIVLDDTFRIDRSLNSEKFFHETGYFAPEWPQLVEEMYEEFLQRGQ